jgi:amidase
VPAEKPSTYELARIAEEYGMDLSEEQLSTFGALAEASIAVYDRLDELPDTFLPVKYPRADLGYRPVGDDNPVSGWSWRCSIKGAKEGKLAGRTVAIKDNVCVAGMPMLNGSILLEGFVPREDATVVTRLLDAGAEIIGKTAVPAFCFDGGGLTGYPEPQPVNPHNHEYLCGASSNGSAAVVVNREVDMALGGDQGGSIRLPSSWSGCCGLKQTHGLVPYTGVFPIEMTLDHVGPLARSVEDCALMLEVIAGEDGFDPRQVGVRTAEYTKALTGDAERMKIGILTEGFGIPEASEEDVDRAVRKAAGSLEKAGASIEVVSVPMHSDGLAIWSAIALEGATYQMVRGDGMGTNWRGHYSTDLVDFYGRARRARANDFTDPVKLTVLVGEYMSSRYNHHYYAKAQNLGRVLRERYAEALDRVDVLVLPTTAMKAIKRPSDTSTEEVIAAALGNLHNTSPFDVTGNPALSVPCGMSGGLPIGMMIVGRHFDEESVLRVGHAYEQLRGPAPTPAGAELARAAAS